MDSPELEAPRGLSRPASTTGGVAVAMGGGLPFGVVAIGRILI